MGILSTLKSVFGLVENRSGPETDTQVTVERERDQDHEAEMESAVSSEQAVKEPVSEQNKAANEPITTIKGIGPAYSERLGDVGVATVEDLAEANITELAAETDISDTRIDEWVERARNRLGS